MNHSPFPSFGANAPIEIRRAGISGVIQPSVHPASRLVERELGMPKPALIFALQLGIGAATAAGTILALFAWGGGAGL
jgi:hypothetical protein